MNKIGYAAETHMVIFIPTYLSGSGRPKATCHLSACRMDVGNIVKEVPGLCVTFQAKHLHQAFGVLPDDPRLLSLLKLRILKVQHVAVFFNRAL